MWVYSIACGSLGIGTASSTSRWSTASWRATPTTSTAIFHYVHRVPTRRQPAGHNQIGEWSLDKRLRRRPPPRNLQGRPTAPTRRRTGSSTRGTRGRRGRRRGPSRSRWARSAGGGTSRARPRKRASAVARAVSGTKWKWAASRLIRRVACDAVGPGTWGSSPPRAAAPAPPPPAAGGRGGGGAGGPGEALRRLLFADCERQPQHRFDPGGAAHLQERARRRLRGGARREDRIGLEHIYSFPIASG